MKTTIVHVLSFIYFGSPRSPRCSHKKTISHHKNSIGQCINDDFGCDTG